MEDNKNLQNEEPFPELNTPQPEQTIYCRNCGNKISARAVVCPHCGVILNEEAYRTAQQAQWERQNQQAPAQTAPRAQASNALAIVGFVLSFFIPLAGLICSIIGLNKVKIYRTGRGLAIAGIVISAVSMVMNVIIQSVFLPYYLELLTSYPYYPTY